jgi:hypothetical protein
MYMPESRLRTVTAATSRMVYSLIAERVGVLFKERSQHGHVHHLVADGISRLRADLVTVGIDPVRAPFEHRSRARGVAVSLLTI